MLETKQLRIFKTVVEVGGFTRASQRLNLSQPAVSQHVRALEKELGVPLLPRVGKATRLTPAGEVLLQCATQVLDKLDEVQRVLAHDGEGRATIDPDVLHAGVSGEPLPEFGPSGARVEEAPATSGRRAG